MGSKRRLTNFCYSKSATDNKTIKTFLPRIWQWSNGQNKHLLLDDPFVRTEDTNEMNELSWMIRYLSLNGCLVPQNINKSKVNYCNRLDPRMFVQVFKWASLASGVGRELPWSYHHGLSNFNDSHVCQNIT